MATPLTTANQLPCAITNDDGTITIWFCWKKAIELAAGQKHSAKCRNIVPSEEPKTKKCVETTYNAVQKDGSCGDEEDDCTYTPIPGQDPENFVTEVCADC
ncbi:MAG: hypothetical protein K8I27_03865 [Planctomycetes bacterium]|nr:hypothetical protein [Planctomycetota bacterium]